MSDDFDTALAKLLRYARARDRKTDHEPRTVTLTDDEALAVCEALAALAVPDVEPEPDPAT